MDKWLARLSRNTIAFLAIAGGIFFFILYNPPHSVCDSQLEVIQRSQRDFLYKDPKSKVAKTAKYQRLNEHCKRTNNPGGCYELFQELRTLLHDLDLVTAECSGRVGGVKEVKAALWESAELIARLAWGEKPPVAYYAKFGWLDTSDIALFCKLKTRLTVAYGEPTFNTFRERIMKELPGAKDLPRNQVWDMSLFSENCARYP